MAAENARGIRAGPGPWPVDGITTGRRGRPWSAPARPRARSPHRFGPAASERPGRGSAALPRSSPAAGPAEAAETSGALLPPAGIRIRVGVGAQGAGAAPR